MKQNYLSARIGILGMGRMSVGLAIDLALKRCRIDMIDLKDRSEEERRKYRENLETECRNVLNILEIEADSFSFPEIIDALSRGARPLAKSSPRLKTS